MCSFVSILLYNNDNLSGLENMHPIESTCSHKAQVAITHR